MMNIKKKYNISFDARGLYEDEIIEKIFELRGIDNPDKFINPMEDDLLPLNSLKRIDEAYNLVEYHITNGNHIGILFDTDLDGISSGAIMTRYLRNYIADSKINTYINEGKQHGLAGQDLNKFVSNDLLIIVDSLDGDIEQYKYLKEELGIDIVVLDHHAIKDNVPYDDYIVLVSSQREYENKNLSGAGVTWKFCKYYDYQNLEEFADELLDLCACGLVGDMVDITNMENRYLISEGLKEINTLAIKKIVGSYEFNSTAIAFSIAPIVNAANRMNKNEYAMKAFLSDDNKEVLANVKVLKQCKEDQNSEVDELMVDVLAQCESQIDKKMIVVFIDSEYGISGLIGNKLLEKYQRPLLILKDCGDKYCGSMRAVGVNDFRKICNDSGLAIANGHELASGIEILKDNLEDFKKYVNENLQELDINMTVNVDMQLDVSDITKRLVDEIKKIDRISGTGFKPVKAYINDITEYEVSDFSQKKHLVIKPSDSLMFIKWNYDGSFEDMEDNSIMNEELEVCCTLDSGFIGRKFSLKCICDSIGEVG